MALDTFGMFNPFSTGTNVGSAFDTMRYASTLSSMNQDAASSTNFPWLVGEEMVPGGKESVANYFTAPSSTAFNYFPWMIGGQLVLGGIASVLKYFETQQAIAAQTSIARQNMLLTWHMNQLRMSAERRRMEHEWRMRKILKEESTGGGAPPTRFYPEGSIRGDVMVEPV